MEIIGNDSMNRYATIKRIEVNNAYSGAYEVTMHNTLMRTKQRTQGFTVEHARTIARAWTFYGALPQRASIA